MNEGWRRRYALPITVAGVVTFLASGQWGSTGIMLIGLPSFIVASWLASGARSPSKIPTQDALIYIAIGVALVIGIMLYTFPTARR